MESCLFITGLIHSCLCFFSAWFTVDILAQRSHLVERGYVWIVARDLESRSEVLAQFCIYIHTISPVPLAKLLSWVRSTLKLGVQPLPQFSHPLRQSLDWLRTNDLSPLGRRITWSTWFILRKILICQLFSTSPTSVLSPPQQKTRRVRRFNRSISPQTTLRGGHRTPEYCHCFPCLKNFIWQRTHLHERDPAVRRAGDLDFGPCHRRWYGFCSVGRDLWRLTLVCISLVLCRPAV